MNISNPMFGTNALKAITHPVLFITLAVVGWGLGWLVVTFSPNKLILGALAIPVIVLALRSTKFLIFLTALALMLTATHVRMLRAPLELMRWGPFFLFGFIVLSQAGNVKMLVRRPYPFDGVILLFLGFALASVTYSIAPMLSIFRATTLILLYVAVFWGIWKYAEQAGELEIIEALVWAVATVIFISVILAPFDYTFFQRDGRFRGLTENPNTIGHLGAFVLPVAIWRALTRRGWFDIALVAAAVLVLALSGSRSAYGAGLIGVIFFLYRRTGNRSRVVTLASLLFVLVAGSFSYIPDAWLNSSYIRLETLASGAGRNEAWSAGLRIANQRPLLGYGFGTEELLFDRFGVTFMEHVGEYAHNSYLGIAQQLGIFGGLLLFTPLLLLFARRLLSGAEFSRSSPIYALEAVLLIGLLTALFESWLYSVGNPYSFFFWVCIMLLVRLDLSSDTEQSHSLPEHEQVFSQTQPIHSRI